jgi:hypothetical protein
MQEITGLIGDVDAVVAVNRLSVSDKVCDYVARAYHCLQLRNLKVRAFNTLFIESIDVVEHIQVELWHSLGPYRGKFKGPARVRLQIGSRQCSVETGSSS